MSIERVPASVIVAILDYLRPCDYVSVSTTNKAVFTDECISDSIFHQLITVYAKFFHIKSAPRTPAEDGSALLYRPSYLYHAEVKAIIAALQTSQISVGDQGYFISSAWHSQAKRYYESINCPELFPIQRSAVGDNNFKTNGMLSPSPHKAGQMLYSTPVRTSSQKKGKRHTLQKFQHRPSPLKLSPSLAATPSSLSSSTSTPTPATTAALSYPSESMTHDITCEHCQLAPIHKNSKFRRRQIEGRVWHFLRQLFPKSVAFRASSEACLICIRSFDQQHPATVGACPVQSADATAIRKSCAFPEGLEGLLNRKTGIPGPCVRPGLYDVAPASSAAPAPASTAASSSSGMRSGASLSLRQQEGFLDYSEYEADDMELALAMSISMSMSVSPTDHGCDPAGSSAVWAEVEGESASSFTGANATSAVVLESRQPLLPGIYHIIPRKWLKLWRQHIKCILSGEGGDSLDPLKSIDYTCLLCTLHGALLLPPHVTDFLLGSKKTLLGQLGNYTGEVVEIVSSDEYELLQQSIHYLSTGIHHFSMVVGDFEPLFALDGESVSWNTVICSRCDPIEDRLLGPPSHKGPNSNANRRK